jgi:rod shape-determining protein MreC
VIGSRGVIGQITRVLPLSSEVTLLTDRNATLPVELQHWSAPSHSAVATTVCSTCVSWPPAATSRRGQRRHLGSGRSTRPACRSARWPASGARHVGIFGRVLIAPTAAIDRSRLMLVLLVDRNVLPPPPSEAPADNRKRKPKPDPS